jgi:predicted nuclease of predicted toxin-antitoxin system
LAALALVTGGHDAVHTLDLPAGNRSTDRAVAEAADADDRILVTKDGDFRDSHRRRASPRRLLSVMTDNIGNDELLPIFGRHLGLLVTALESAGMVELGTTAWRSSKSRSCRGSTPAAGRVSPVRERRSGAVCVVMAHTQQRAPWTKPWTAGIRRKISREARPSKQPVSMSTAPGARSRHPSPGPPAGPETR